MKRNPSNLIIAAVLLGAGLFALGAPLPLVAHEGEHFTAGEPGDPKEAVPHGRDFHA